MPAQKYPGAANPTSITNSITALATSCILASTTGWPDGSDGQFVVVIDPDLPTQEKILCDDRSGTTLNFAQRGFDGTTASSHGSNAVIRPSMDAASLQRHEDHVFDSTDAHAASAITVTPVGTVTATNVQSAIAELDSEKATSGHSHTAQTATTTAFTPAGNIAATNVQAAIEELDSEKSGTGHTHAASGTVIFNSTHTWTIQTPAVESGDTDFIIPITIRPAAGETVEVESVTHKINSGTSVTWDLTKNGSNVTGFTSLSSTTTSTNTNPTNQSLADGDKVKPDVSAVTGSPARWEVTLVLKHTVAVA